MVLAAGTIGGTAGQISQNGLYFFLAALFLISAGAVTLVLTGKLRFAREVEVTEKQLEASNVLLASYNEAEVKKTREGLESIEEKLDKTIAINERLAEENKVLRESVLKFIERQENAERWNYANNRLSGGGGNNVREASGLDNR